MANFVFNAALGRIAEKISDGATLGLLVLQASDTDAAHKDVATVAALLALGATTEATFTNYARKTLAGVVATVDNALDSVKADATDVVFTAAGGALNNTTTDVVIFEDVGGVDSTRIPLVQLDAVFTTDGNDVTLQFHADGFWGSS
jgi:hypothetical protein